MYEKLSNCFVKFYILCSLHIVFTIIEVYVVIVGCDLFFHWCCEILWLLFLSVFCYDGDVCLW